MRYSLWIALIAAALVAVAVAPRTAYQGVVVTILYSGDTYGQLESCG